MKTERSQVGTGFWFWWLIAGVTGLGVGLGLLGALIETLASLSSIVSSITVVAVAGAVVGASLGVAQWLVLRRHIPRAGWWVLATLGFAVCFYGASAVAAIVVGAVAFYSGVPESAVLLTWFLVAVGVVGGALYGGITGVLMVLLLRQPNPDVSSPPQEAV